MSELTEEQQGIISAVHAVCERYATSTQVRESFGASISPLWEKLAHEIGAAAIAIPEEHDGVGMTSFESHLVLETLGQYLVHTPFLSSAIVVAEALLASGDDDARARNLSSIAAGEMVATLAWATPQGTWDPPAVEVTAREGASGWELDGSVPYVWDGAEASLVLAIAQTPQGPGLFEVEATHGVEATSTPSLDPTLSLSSLRFASCPGRLLTQDPQALERIYNTFVVALTALQVGVGQRALSMTVEYAGQRVQFGRPIGSFQALKHRMADMHVALETSRSISRAAAKALTRNSGDAARLAAMAKDWCSRSLNLIASETVQLHGGIAITWEHDAHLVFKRAHALDQLLGQASDQRQILATQLGMNT